MRAVVGFLTGLVMIHLAAGCIEHDAVPPVCTHWVDPHGGPVFFPHQFNCSRYWVCEPDLTDCLFECAPCNPMEDFQCDGLYALEFDNVAHVCRFPTQVNCTNKSPECSKCEPWQECVECNSVKSNDCQNGWTCTPDCKLDVHCNDDEYCDFNDGGDGNCHKGCRTGESCAVNNNVACGTCTNHVCNEPECCNDDDCDGVCENGVCTGCATDSDCVETACSTCENNQCYDPECCTDDDCLDTQICDDNHKCKDGCRDNSDCNSNMVCAVCQADNTCTNPGCCADSNCLDTQYCDENNQCTDGCNEDSDCTSNMACAFCQDDHSCTEPECCEDDDCPSGYCHDNVCIAGCKQDSECDQNEGPCNGNYTPEGASCFYCDMSNGDIGSCTPGCSSSLACPGDLPICAAHICKAEGGTSVLRSIQFTTKSCDGCAQGNAEEGPVLSLTGKAGTNGQTTCSTLGLDHKDRIDFSQDNPATFDKDDDDAEQLFDTCYLASLQNLVVEATISWPGSGQWSIKNNQIDFDWTGNGACPSSCCVTGPLASGKTYTMECEENCSSSIIC